MKGHSQGFAAATANKLVLVKNAVFEHTRNIESELDHLEKFLDSDADFDGTKVRNHLANIRERAGYLSGLVDGA